LATAPDGMVEVFEYERDVEAVLEVGGSAAVTVGSHAGADSLSSADAMACTAAGKKQKRKYWSPEEHTAVMEA
jgi:hypothetical protein